MTRDRLSRRTIVTLLIVVIASLVLERLWGSSRLAEPGADTTDNGVELPPPRRGGDVAVEDAIADRRSRREFADDPLKRAELGQLLWAAQGITDPSSGFRAAPSAGALYPLELYVVVGDPGVTGVESGVYHYRPETHELVRGNREVNQGDLRAAAVDQEHVEEASVDIVVTAVDERTTQKYGERGRRRYVPMEAGHASENVYLQAEALGLAMVTVGAFSDEQVIDVLGVNTGQRPLYILPIGKRI